MTNTEYVTEIYNNVFGRTPDAGGLVNWVNQLDHTSITGINRGNIMTYMLASAGAPGNTDGERLDNQAAFAVQSILDGVPEATATAQLANITSDDATVTAAKTTIAAQNPGSTFALTSSADVKEGTAGNDTFTATNLTYTTGDVVIGGEGFDTLNLSMTANPAATPSTVVGIEKINVNATSFTDLTYDAAGVVGVGTTITFNNLQAAGATGATVSNVATGATVVAGSGVTGTFTVDADGYATINGGSATTVTVDLNGVATSSTITANSATTVNVNNAVAATVSSTSAATINVEGTAGTSDTVTISAKNASSTAVIALETLGAGQQVEKLILSGNGGAATYDLDATGDNTTTLTFTGSQNVTFVATAAQLSGDTATDTMTAGTSTIKIDTTSAATHDLDALAVDLIDIAATTAAVATYTVANNQAVKLSATAGGHVTLDAALASGAETLNLTVKASQTSNVVVTDFETVNLTVDDAATTTGNITLADLQGTAATAGVINVSGADNLILTGANATFLNAAAFTGKLTATLASDLLKVTGGTGNDTINASALAFTVDGGAGTDTLVFDTSTNLTTVAETISNIEVLAIDAANGGAVTLTVDTAAISGKSYIVTGTGTNDILSVVTSQTGSLDLSTLTVDDADIAVTIDLTSTAGVANTIVGSNADDTLSNAGAGVITVDGGAGADSLTTGSAADIITAGEGADTIDANGGADSINLAETVAAIDTVVLAAGDSTEAAMDKISGFTTHASTGDVLNINTTTAAASIGATDVSGVTSEASDVVTASTSATGIMTLSGANAANIDTLAEWIDAAEVLLTTLVSANTTADFLGVLAFEFNGNTYVVEGSDTVADAYTTSVVVELTGVTGITGLSATAAANVIDIA